MPKSDAGTVENAANSASFTQRMADFGPRYRETPFDPLLDGGFPAEPWNTVTAFLFVIIVLVWLVRLRGRYHRYPFIVSCLPILLAGGVGGTLYHGFRSSQIYFLLDVVPITLLGAAGAIYLLVRLNETIVWDRLLFMIFGLISVYIGFNLLIRQFPFSNPNLPVNLSYASLALILLVPLCVMLVKTRFAHSGWVFGGLFSFGIGWFCRLIDNTGYDALPMGTHWLWHIFGALTTYALTEYFYRLETDYKLRRSSTAEVKSW